MTATTHVTPPRARDPLPFEALRQHGLLWLINRVVFHPRGFALGLTYPDDATLRQIEAHEVEPIGFTMHGDGRDPWHYACTAEAPESAIDEKAALAAVEAFFAQLRFAAGPTGCFDKPDNGANTAGAEL